MQTEQTLRTDSNAYNQGTKQMQLLHEELNATLNFHKLNTLLNNGKARDIADEPCHNDEACLVIGSGASLEDALPLLKDWKGGIICTTSHALTLVKFGAPPTHIFALDPFCTQEEIEGVDWTQYGTKLITVPSVWPSLIEYWPNEMLLYRQSMGNPQSFYASTLNHMYCDRYLISEEECLAICARDKIERSKFNSARAYKFVPRIRTEVTLFACSPPVQVFVAHLMGYKSIFLVGCDFAYTKNKDRFTNWTMENGEWVAHENPLVEDNVHLTTTNGILSSTVHIYYKKNMLSALRLLLNDDPTVQLVTTDHGAITELPYIDIEHVVEKQGKHIARSKSGQQLADDIEVYLASVGAHCIFADIGKQRSAMVFMESANPEKEILDHMIKMNLAYRCTVCGAEVMAPQDTHDYEGKECPVCKRPMLHHKAKVNVDENMFRLRSRIVNAEKMKVEHASD